jgi:hypothetical protein
MATTTNSSPFHSHSLKTKSHVSPLNIATLPPNNAVLIGPLLTRKLSSKSPASRPNSLQPNTLPDTTISNDCPGRYEDLPNVLDTHHQPIIPWFTQHFNLHPTPEHPSKPAACSGQTDSQTQNFTPSTASFSALPNPTNRLLSPLYTRSSNSAIWPYPNQTSASPYPFFPLPLSERTCKRQFDLSSSVKTASLYTYPPTRSEKHLIPKSSNSSTISNYGFAGLHSNRPRHALALLTNKYYPTSASSTDT